MFLAADAIDVAVQLNFVFETGFSNLQFMAMAAIADNAHDHLFEKALASIQTDESRHAQIGHPVLRILIDHGDKERAQYLVDKMWWRCWRLFIALTGTAMEYLTPVRARTRSFRQFMEEWIIEQFIKNLSEFRLERPWFWELFLEELDFAHHSLQLGLYAYRTTLWFDVAAPDTRERSWLASAYPSGRRRSAPSGTRLNGLGKPGASREQWRTPCRRCATFASCQPYLSDPGATPHVPPRRTVDVIYSVLNPAVGSSCRADRRWAQKCRRPIVAGTAPGKLTDLHRWMGLEAPIETGKDLARAQPRRWTRSTGLIEVLWQACTSSATSRTTSTAVSWSHQSSSHW